VIAAMLKKKITDPKVHRMFSLPLTWIEINKKALEHNIRNYKSLVGHAALAPVVKSNAYGHGLVEVAAIAQENPLVEWLCLANLSDAVALREQGCTKSLLVLGYCDIDPLYAAQHNIHVTVYDKQMIQELSDVGRAAKKIIFVHLKVDTGLRRLGFFPQEVPEILAYMRTLPGITVAGIGSHFAESHHPDQEFTQEQAHQFHALLVQLAQQKITIPFRHVANSAGAINVAAPLCNLVRVGAGIYGMWPSEFTQSSAQNQLISCQLQPVLTWKTRIITMRDLPAHTFVGYDRTHVTTSKTKAAVVPIGYFDGYSRRLSNIGIMTVRGKSARVMGRVSMNMTMIDVTGIDGVSVGDEVTIIGGDDANSPKKIAELIGSFNQREITALLHPSIKRIIV
jgi:alanine racemase